MEFDTFLFGRIDVQPDAILEFPDGMPAFEQCKRYTLLHEEGGAGSAVTHTLQSLDDPAVAFQIADPTAYGFHYELDLTDGEIAKLKLADPADIVVMLVLFRREDKQSPIEVNIGAPLLINTASRIGMQKVLEHRRTNLTLSNLSQRIA